VEGVKQNDRSWEEERRKKKRKKNKLWRGLRRGWDGGCIGGKERAGTWK